MENLSTIVGFVASFIIIALASKQIGQYFTRFKLPLISGFLVAGILAGPFVLRLVSQEAIERLRFVDEISLAFIAFAAGSELYLKELRGRLRSITSVTIWLVLVTFVIGSLVVYLLSTFIPFMHTMSAAGRIGVSVLAGAILVARSPSSAIAIINELRAKGPLTQVGMSVIVVTDVVVIMLFGFSSSVADALLTNVGFNLGFALLLIFELLISILIGYFLGRLLLLFLVSHFSSGVKSGLILLSGYSMFLLSAWFRSYTHENWSFEVLVEPLLVCMIASFIVTNFSNYRDELMGILHDLGPGIYIAFFTLTGASLALDILISIWPIALILFFVRLVTIIVGAFGGGVIAGDPMKYNRISWMLYITQAGVGLGLAKEVAVEFPDWGAAFATMIISVIVLNQVTGPPFFKWAINQAGEAHARATPLGFDGIRDVLIFGLKPESVTLANQLERHDWQVKLVCISDAVLEELVTPDLDIHVVDEISVATLRQLDAEHADAIVSFLSDEKSYQLCDLAYEHFGTETMVVQLRDRANFDRFHELGVLVVEPQTALISLLEHLVRSPAGTLMLLGMDEEQDMIDVEVRDPDLHGMALRDLRLPLDVMILSIHRNGHTLVTRGHTQFHLGDKVTMVGPAKRLEETMLRFDA